MFDFLLQSFADPPSDLFVSSIDFKAYGPNEISLDQGQVVEVLSRPPGSRSWRVRPQGDVLHEGLVPFAILKRYDEGGRTQKLGKKSSLETLNSHSSEGNSNSTVNFLSELCCSFFLFSILLHLNCISRVTVSLITVFLA